MPGLIAYGAYVPYHRLKRAEIAAVLGEGGGKGSRSVASFDEDPTSMAVEAGRHALRGLPHGVAPDRLLFATANPPYLDKTNANVVHAALDLDPKVLGRRRGRLGSLRCWRPAAGRRIARADTGHSRRCPQRAPRWQR